MWKRVALLVLLFSLLSFPSGSADTSEQPWEPTGHNPDCKRVIQDDVLPYGTKNGPGFTSPQLHGLKLVYEIKDTQLTNGHTYQLYAQDPVTSTIPDFDVLFELPGGTAIHNSMGSESGTVPQGAVRAYVYMPVGPDDRVAPGNVLGTVGAGAFTFEHC